MCCNCYLRGDKDASSPASKCLAVTKKGVFRFFDENKPYIFFALLIFSVFVIFSRNTDVFLASLKFLQSLNRASQLGLFVLLFVFVSQPISWGYIVLNVSAGFLYGFMGGVLVVCLSSSIGISFVHFANRVCFKQCLSKVITKLPQRVTPMMELLRGKHAFKLVLLSRLTPLPFGLMNAFFAVSDVSNLDYIVASVLGLLPTQAINAYIGTTLKEIEEVTESKHNKSYYIILIFQIAACFLVSSLVVRLANQNLDSKLQQVTTSNSNNTGSTSICTQTRTSHATSEGGSISLSVLEKVKHVDDSSDVEDFSDTKELLPTHSLSNHHIVASQRQNGVVGMVKDELV